MLYGDITKKIIGACFKIHSELGNGFPEKIYHRCLIIELEDIKLQFSSEIELPLYYKNYLIGTRRADIVVEKKVLVELKAVSELTTAHHAQILNYLKIYRLQVGLLINFGEESLNFKRFIRSPT